MEKKVTPVYPELARRMHISGEVRIAATVAANGNVTNVKAVGGNALLTSAAEEAVRKWKFAAADAASKETVVINFAE